MKEYQIQINDETIVYQLTYKHMQNIRMRVRDGQLLISAPYGTSLIYIEQMIHTYQKRILTQIHAFQPYYQYNDGGYVLIFNQRYRLVVRDIGVKRCQCHGHDLYVYHYDFLGKLVGGPYKLTRFNGWLHPEENVGGDGYHLYMALLAIGSSGLTGHGMGVNLVDIPEAQTDFIFAVIGQSWGLIGTVFIVILCAALDLYLCRIATACENMFEKYIVIGVLGILIYQQFQNIGMVIGLLPITGITLPLISYGGSSIISYMIAFGIIFNASCKSKKHVE